MSKFGKKQEDQLLYKNSKLEKANQELMDRINNELIPEINKLRSANNLSAKITILTLFELGGFIEISHDDLNNTTGKIVSKVDPEKKITTFYIENEDQIKST